MIRIFCNTRLLQISKGKLLPLLLALALLPVPAKSIQPGQTPDLFERPFAPSSFWNRKIPEDATYIDVSDAIWGDPGLAPNRVGVEQVTLIYSDPHQPEVKIVKSRGWNMPGRAQTSGEVFYTSRFAPDAGVEVRYPSTGNASFVIIDPLRGTASEGSAGWREPGGDLITYYDEPRLHDIDLAGDGLSGTLGSGLPALGGLIRLGEINSQISHSIAISMGSRRFSRAPKFIAPAWRADGFADSPLNGYFGKDPNYGMGTLLAIPRSVDIEEIDWQTEQGKILARSAREYGWVIVDSSDGGIGNDQMKLNFSRDAARIDLGLEVRPENDELFVARPVLDIAGLEADIITIMGLVMATRK